MGRHSVLLLSTFAANSKAQCHTLETRLKNQYRAFPLSEITHKSLWGAIKCFCANVQIFFFPVCKGGRQRKGCNVVVFISTVISPPPHAPYHRCFAPNPHPHPHTPECSLYTHFITSPLCRLLRNCEG